MSCIGDKLEGLNHQDLYAVKLTLCNSAFWGSPVVGAIVNNGTLCLRQANFASCGAPASDTAQFCTKCGCTLQ